MSLLVPKVLRCGALALVLVMGRFGPAYLHRPIDPPRSSPSRASSPRARPADVQPDPAPLCPQPLIQAMTETAAVLVATRASAQRLPVDPDAALAWGEKLYRRGEYTRAIPYLEWAAYYLTGAGADRANLLLAYVRYFFGETVAAQDRLARVREMTEESAQLQGCLSAPFFRRYGAAARAIEGRTPTYALATDVGFDRTQPSNAKLLEYGALLERIRIEYLATFHLYRSATQEPLVPHVFIFRSTREFQEFSASICAPSAGRAGYYDPALRTIVIDASAGNELREVIFHEAFHEFLGEYVRNAPTWLDEGLAEYFGACPSEAGPLGIDVPLAGPEDGRLILRALLEPRGRRLLTPLRDLVRMDYDAFHRKDMLHYAEAWSFVHFLLHGWAPGRQMLTKYFDALARGVKSAEAREEVFGLVSWDALEEEWARYAQKLVAEDAPAEALHFRFPVEDRR